MYVYMHVIIQHDNVYILLHNVYIYIYTRTYLQYEKVHLPLNPPSKAAASS